MIDESDSSFKSKNVNIKETGEKHQSIFSSPNRFDDDKNVRYKYATNSQKISANGWRYGGNEP